MANEQAKAFIDQATQSLQNSQFQQALDLVDQAIAIEPGATDSFVLRGICLSQLGQPDAATEAFRKAIMLSPYNAKAYYNLAVHQNSLGNKKEAAELAREAVGVDPRHSGARQLLNQLEQELMGTIQAPAGARTDVTYTNDPLATPPPAAPSGPGNSGLTASGTPGAMEAPPGTGVSGPAMSRPPSEQPAAPGAPPSGSPYANAPQGSPYSANYVRQGYAQSSHSIPWIENMGTTWTAIGWTLAACSFLILIGLMGAMAAAFQHLGQPGAALPTNFAMVTTPLGMIALGIRFFCFIWILLDVIDRKTSWFWVVGLVILGCCCASPWLILPFYLGLGRKEK